MEENDSDILERLKNSSFQLKNNNRYESNRLFAENLHNSLERSIEKYKLKESKNSSKIISPIKEKIRKPFLNMFNDLASWSPPNHGRPFEKSQKFLKHAYEPDDWELLRINLSKRSYSKQQEFKEGKAWVAPKVSIGRVFGENNGKLHQSGENLIKIFVKENTQRGEKMKKLEESFEKYKKSKPPPFISGWNNSMHQRDVFSKLPGNESYGYREVPKTKHDYTNPKPFLRPKVRGNLFGGI